MQTVVAFFVKKFTFTRKNPWTFSISMILPCVSALLMILDHSGTTKTQKSSLSLNAYSNTRSLVYAEQKIYGDKYATSAKEFHGTATYIGSNYSLTDGRV